MLQGGAQVRKRTQIRNRYNQAPHLTQGTNGKVTTLQLDIASESKGQVQGHFIFFFERIIYNSATGTILCLLSLCHFIP